MCVGSTYIACDWEEEVREKCYNEDMSKVHCVEWVCVWSGCVCGVGVCVCVCGEGCVQY